jgi:hypothetical protein
MVLDVIYLFGYKIQVTKMVLDVIYIFGCLLNPVLKRKVSSLGLGG